MCFGSVISLRRAWPAVAAVVSPAPFAQIHNHAKKNLTRKSGPLMFAQYHCAIGDSYEARLRTRFDGRTKSGRATSGSGDAAAGDVIVVTRLDRLARSTRDLLNILDRLGKDEIGFQSLRETAIDTTTPHGRLTISILAAIAEFERELTLSRVHEGRKRAVAAGVKFGPKFKLDTFQKREALNRLQAGESLSLVARTYGVDTSTIWRLQKRAEMSA